MNKVRKVIDRFPAWSFTIATSVLILWLTLAPHPVGELKMGLFPGADKVVHAIMFGALTGAMLLDYERRRGWQTAGAGFVALAVATGTMAGVVIEFAQEAMHIGRSFDVADMVADFVGAFITGVLWHIIRLKIDGGKEKS
ncbi:MAG: VanZ family protein [Muribaculaceae bacterium]|nr:VanZ family protein [Muribaculaceae bacterium]